MSIELYRSVYEETPVKNDYSLAEIRFLLENGEMTLPFSTYEMPDLDSRFDTDLLPAEKKYQGKWYKQGPEATCTPWSIVNAMKAIGIEPEPISVMEMVNSALKNKRDGKNGTTYKELIPIAERKGDISLSLLHDTNNLRHFPSKPLDERRYAQEVTKHNAGLITQFVSKDSALTVALPQQSPNRRPHSVCIAGYTVDTDGFMDVQIIDSAKKVYKSSLEAFSQRVSHISASTLVVGRK